MIRQSGSAETGASPAGVYSPDVAGALERSRVRFNGHIRAAILVFVGYYLGSRVGFFLTFPTYPISTLWPPNAILTAALLLTPTRLWWLVVAAALPAHVAIQLQSNVP